MYFGTATYLFTHYELNCVFSYVCEKHVITSVYIKQFSVYIDSVCPKQTDIN